MHSNSESWGSTLQVFRNKNVCCEQSFKISRFGCCCWLLLLVATASCVCCCCCWKLFEYFRDFSDLRLRQFCRRKKLWKISGADDLRLRQFCRRKSLWINSGADDLRLRQFCRRKSLWIFSGADDLSLKIFGLLRKSLWIFPEYWWEGGGREFRLGEVG